MNKAPAGKPTSASQTVMTEIVLPQHTNPIGTMFGGAVMSWVDIAAATAGMRHANRQVVTASLDAMHFIDPIKLGWIVTLKASVNYVHKTSCEIGVRIESENPITGEHFHNASAYLTFVSLDSNGRPVAMPPIIPEDDDAKRRFKEAEERRQSRLNLKTAIKERRQRDH